MSIVSLFCEIDDFFLEYEKCASASCLPETSSVETRGRPRNLHPSEVMTILIAFHQSNYRTFKHFYQKHVCVYYRAEFPQLVSYSRFVQLKKEVLRLLTFYLSTHTGTCSGISFVDSTRLRVCDNKRISSHKVFAQKISERGKTSMGWFYGFKLHLIINDTGDILDVALTPGNRDDRSPLWGMNPETPLHGSLYGDRGYISQDLREKLHKQGINLVYKVRKNMDPLDVSVSDAVLLKKRTLVESVIKELKTRTVLEHSRHRSFENFYVNVFSALIAYQLSANKPALNFDELQQSKDVPMPVNNSLFPNSRYICKYTVPADVTGEFGAAVGKLSVDREGNTLAKFYTHAKKVTLGVDTIAPEVKEVGYYSDSKLTQPLRDTVEPGITIFTKIVFSEPMRFKAADDDDARPILYYQLNGKRVRYRVSEHGANGKNFASGDAKSLDDGTDAYVCKYIVPADGVGEFGAAVGKFSADREGNILAKFYTHKKKVQIRDLDTTPPVRQVSYYTDRNLTNQVTGGRGGHLPVITAGSIVYTKVVFSSPVQPVFADGEAAHPALFAVINDESMQYRVVASGVRERHFISGTCKPMSGSDTIYICRYDIPIDTFGTLVLQAGDILAARSSLHIVPSLCFGQVNVEPTDFTYAIINTRNHQDFAGQVLVPVSRKPRQHDRGQSPRRRAQPISGVTVTIVSGSRSGESVVTDGNGHYIFPSVDGDELHLHVEKECFEPKKVIVHRSLPTTLANGDAINFFKGPQKNPGVIIIGQSWPEPVRDLLQLVPVVRDLLYIEDHSIQDYGGYYFEGVIAINTVLEGSRRGADGVLRLFAHEIAHAHQHGLVTIDGSGDMRDWDNTPEGISFAEAWNKDMREFGKSKYDHSPGFSSSFRESAAETFAYVWRIGRWRQPDQMNWKLETDAPHRFQWAKDWTEKMQQ